MVEKFRHAYNSFIANIPTANRELYRIVFCDYRLAVFAEPDRYEELTGELWAKMHELRDPRKQHTPPSLLKRRGESVDQWLDRCYQAGGYGNASK